MPLPYRNDAVSRMVHAVDQARPRLIDRLRRSYRKTCDALLEDALQQAILTLVESPEGFEQAWAVGERALMDRIVTVAWRVLRSHYRRAETRLATADVHLVELPCEQMDPFTQVSGLELVLNIDELAQDASRRFGGSRPEQLHHALWIRIAEDGSDAAAARRGGVPREYVNRARRWMAGQLHAA